MKLNSTKGTGRHVGSNSKTGGDLAAGEPELCVTAHHGGVGVLAWASKAGGHLMDQAEPQPGDSMGCSSTVRALAQGHSGAWDSRTRLANFHQVSPAQAVSLLQLSQVSGQKDHNILYSLCL